MLALGLSAPVKSLAPGDRCAKREVVGRAGPFRAARAPRLWQASARHRRISGCQACIAHAARAQSDFLSLAPHWP